MARGREPRRRLAIRVAATLLLVGATSFCVYEAAVPETFLGSATGSTVRGLHWTCRSRTREWNGHVAQLAPGGAVNVGWDAEVFRVTWEGRVDGRVVQGQQDVDLWLFETAVTLRIE